MPTDPIAAAQAANLPDDIAESTVEAVFSGRRSTNHEVHLGRAELRGILNAAIALGFEASGKLPELEDPATAKRTQAGERIFAEQAADPDARRQGLRIVESSLGRHGLEAAGPYTWVFGAGTSALQVSVLDARFLLEGLATFVREAEEGLLSS